VTAGLPEVAAAPAAPGARRRRVAAILRNPLAVASLVILIAMVVVAVIGPWIQPNPPNAVQLRLTNAPPFSGGYLLGGDNTGRDILSRLIAGTRGAAEAAVILTVVAAALGVTGGLIAGYFGKLFDSVGSWVFAVLMACPGIVILIALYTVVGASPNVAMAVLGVLSAPGFFWPVRTLTRTVRAELYVDAARVSGLPAWRIVGRHVFLTIRGPIIILAAFMAGAAISVQAALQFLGLGNPAVPSWGGMLSDAFDNVYVAPVQLVWPGLALGLVTASFVLLGNALRDASQGTAVRQGAHGRRREIKALFGAQASDLTLRTGSRPATVREKAAEPGTAPLLRIDGLTIAYHSDNGAATVVDGISLEVAEGEVVGLVGESGAGKTQAVFATLGLLPDEAIVVGGSIWLDGAELLRMPEKDLARLRGATMAYVPQEPMSNLDPSFTVGSQLVYGIRAQTGMRARHARELALSMLDRVGITDPVRTFGCYPHQISGGMAQRVLIAGAVACNPRLLLADEPTTSLDVTIQAEILDLLRSLQKEGHMGMLIVTHNFGVVADLCDRVLVMRSGKIVEEGPVTRVFRHPEHDYTKMLLGSILDDAEPRGAEVPAEVADA
jgi:peptide/nickel transport system permease protein